MMVINAVKDALKTEKSETRKKLEALFEQTKLVGFGRYVLRVPLEAKLNFGKTRIYDGYEVYEGEGDQLKKLINEKWDKVKYENSTAKIIKQYKGPVEGAAGFLYYDSDTAEEMGLIDFYGVVPIHGHAFVYKGGDEPSKGYKYLQKQFELIKQTRFREENELPKQPGVVLPFGFVREDKYEFQEMFDAGIYLPSFPDIRFFVSSNVGSYVGEEYTLLKKIQKQKDLVGFFNYPSIKTLREGKKKVNIWEGEEYLGFRNKEGYYEFKWEGMNEKRSVGFPGRIEAGLKTKVKKNTTGAAEVSSIEDDEDVVWLWDQLLGSLDFRVPVPGSSKVAIEINSQKVWRPGDKSPVDGYWKAYIPGWTKEGYSMQALDFKPAGYPLMDDTVLYQCYKMKREEIEFKLVYAIDPITKEFV